jgi:hypothetical protein
MSMKYFLIFVVCLSGGLFSSAFGEPFRIVVAGDGRAQYPWLGHRSCDDDGMNRTVNEAIRDAVLKEQAKMLLWTGDIVNINDSNTDTLQKGLESWRDIMEPLYKAHVEVWPVRGNHEVYRYVCPNNYDGEPIPNATRVWKTVFSGPYGIHADGPKDKEGLSFYAIRHSALIIGLDDYERPSSDPLRRKHSIDQQWLDRILNDKKNKQQPLKFVFGHEAAFMAGHHTDDDTLAADTYARNVFWQSLVNAGAQIYFCGHDHFYDRMSVVRGGPNPGRELFQITAGTAGAPGYSRGPHTKSSLWDLRSVQCFDDAYGYMLIEIDEGKATVTFKGSHKTSDCPDPPLEFGSMDKFVCDRSGCKAALP